MGSAGRLSIVGMSVTNKREIMFKGEVKKQHNSSRATKIEIVAKISIFGKLPFLSMENLNVFEKIS